MVPTIGKTSFTAFTYFVQRYVSPLYRQQRKFFPVQQQKKNFGTQFPSYEIAKIEPRYILKN